MIRFDLLTLRRGTKLLLDRVSLTLHPGEKVGLVGANGAGKTTLFALLRGELQPDGGELTLPPSWQIAYVSQQTPAIARSALDYTLDGDAALRAIETRIAHAAAAADGMAEAEAHAAFADADGYTASARAQALLIGLGFSLAEIDRPVASFSGGWRMRLNLAQALMCRSDLLLLDEPTNHLDLDAIIWLENWLARYTGTLLVISHDREFLDAVAQTIVHLDALQLKRYSGHYSQFEQLRAQQLTQQKQAYDQQQRKIADLQHFIDRFRAKASKARQAQSRIKSLERLKQIAPIQPASPFSFSFRSSETVPDPMLTFEGIDCGYRLPDGDQPIVSGVTLSLRSGQRIGLLGANGQGKSTLIKTLAGVLPPLAGEHCINKGLAIGYFAQHQLEMLSDNDSPLTHLMRLAPAAREQELRDYLGSFNFRGEMAIAPIAPFSGGEKARLALALIIWKKPNLLLLDEPTNHLDLDTRHALTIALAQFEGTLIVVSHDRHLLRATADQFMLIADHRLQPFDGDLDDYRHWLLQRAASPALQWEDADGTSAEVKASHPHPNRKAQRRASAQARQALAQLRQPWQVKLDQLDKELERLSAEKTALDAILADPANYESARKIDLTGMQKRQAHLAAQLNDIETAWLNAREALEQIG